MSTICLESNSAIGTTAESQITAAAASADHEKSSNEPSSLPAPQQTVPLRTLAKLPNVSAASGAAKASLITVLNTPLGNMKTLCVTPAVSSSSAPGQFTVTPLNVANSATVKPQTITLINTPVTVVKTIPPPSSGVEKHVPESVLANHNNTAVGTAGGGMVAPPATFVENRGHNVFVKNTPSSSVTSGGGGGDHQMVVASHSEMPQSHKILTANNFPTNNVLTSALNVSDKTANGQRNKVKILSNIVMPSSSSHGNPGNILLNKQQPNSAPQRYISRPKIVGPNNGLATKYLNKQPPVSSVNNLLNKSQVNVINKHHPGVQQHRVLYPTHKSQLKTLPPINNYMHAGGKASSAHGIKTLPPQPKGMLPGQMQRTGSGLRTIPPQRPQKMPNKPNYIGKHAVQAQKMKGPPPPPHHHHHHPHHHKMKGMKAGPPHQMYNSYHHHHHHGHSMAQVVAPPPDKQLTFNQALTAEILETLGNNKAGAGGGASGSCYPATAKSYEMLAPSRFDSGYYTTDMKPSFANEVVKSMMEEPTKSGLDTLSLICQAVLLDHNYNATLPPDSPTRSLPIPNTPAQINGVSSTSMYSPGAVSGGKRRTISTSNPISASTSLSTLSAVASNSNSLVGLQADDAGSDLSDTSDRKHDTEGEETDTAPEAEAVNNEDPFGDYVTRCLCGFVHDDGYMVQCDTCKVWQHVVCVLKNKQVPDDYYCEVCDPRKFIDRQRARIIQQQWLKERELNASALDPKLLKEKGAKATPMFRQKSAPDAATSAAILSDSDTSDGEHGGARNVKTRPTMANRRKSEGGRPRQRRDLKDMVQRRQIKKRGDKKVTKRKTKLQKVNHHQQQHHSDDENAESMHLPQLRQWIENYEEAVTNHYSPELRARISSIRVNGAAHTDTPVQYDPSVHKCRVHSQPLTELKYLVSTVHLPPNSPVIELRGKYMLSAQHRNTGAGGGGGGSFNTRQHAQRPGPFLFFYRLHKDNTEVCVDTRTYGNSARFIRRSCRPNAELRHTIVKGVLHLYVVSIVDVEKNVELTVKHESHDLAAIGTTNIACACGNADECTVNRTTIKKNGDSTEIHKKRRGRRATSLTMPPEPAEVKKEVPAPPPPQQSPISPHQSAVTSATVTTTIKQEEVDIKMEVDCAAKTDNTDADDEGDEEKERKAPVKEDVERKCELKIKDEVEAAAQNEEKPEEKVKMKEEPADESDLKKEQDQAQPSQEPQMSAVTTRRSSAHHKSDKEDQAKEGKDDCSPVSATLEKSKNKKLSREERKLEAILRAIEQMEKKNQRKQEHQAKQAHRRESEPAPSRDHHEHHPQHDKGETKVKRKRRKGRARTASTHTPVNRRNRLNSTDSYMTSGDETSSLLLSPNNEPPQPHHSLLANRMHHPHGLDEQSIDKDAGLLLALSNGDKEKLGLRGDAAMDSNSNSAHSSPETHLSPACLLVQAAVEPMEHGFKFPKTKKGLMNEWLNKVPEPVHQSATSISPSALAQHIDFDANNASSGTSFYNHHHPSKGLVALAQVASFCGGGGADATSNAPNTERGSAKKRWLRQAISEDQCDSPSGRGTDSPPLSETLAPPKKRRLPRESLSNDITPPTTPTGLVPPPLNSSECQSSSQEGNINNNNNNSSNEASCAGPPDEDDDMTASSVSQSQLESDLVGAGAAPTIEDYQQQQQAIVVSEMREIDSKFPVQESSSSVKASAAGGACLMDPRLSRDHRAHQLFSNSDHLVGTVEKTLSIFGFQDRKPEAITPQKRKLSITEYRQRKKLNNNDKCLEDQDQNSMEENTQMEETLKPLRARSDSTSSCTSITSSDEDAAPSELPEKAPSAFNSEPTELERQREITSLRLKKAFGIAVDEEVKKPALDVETLLSCEIPTTLVKPTIPPSPTFPIPGTCDTVNLSQDVATVDTPPPLPSPPVSATTVVEESRALPDEAANVPVIIEEKPETEENDEEDEVVAAATETSAHYFYTPDEDEGKAKKSSAVVFDEVESVVEYVPPFNNPIYPNSSDFTTSAFTSVIDEEGRYEGRNPSPPPDLNMDNKSETSTVTTTIPGQST